MVGKIEEIYLQIIPPTMSLLTILAVYLIGKRLFGTMQGKVESLFLLFTPILIYSSIPTLLDTTLMFYSTMYILFLTLGVIQRGDRTRYWVMSALFYGFSLLVSYRALYLSIIFILSLFYLAFQEKAGQKIPSF